MRILLLAFLLLSTSCKESDKLDAFIKDDQKSSLSIYRGEVLKLREVDKSGYVILRSITRYKDRDSYFYYLYTFEKTEGGWKGTRMKDIHLSVSYKPLLVKTTGYIEYKDLKDYEREIVVQFTQFVTTLGFSQ